MTASDVLGAIGRRWYVLIVGLVLVAAACLQLQRAPGVFWSQVDVVFLAPQSAQNPNVLGITSQSLISTAGVVSSAVNEGIARPALSSTAASLVGEGIRSGYWVRLPNSGGQWANNFERPVLDVQVAAASEREVRVEVDRLLAEIGRTLDDLQIRSGTADVNRITTEFAPRTPVVQFVGTESTRATLAAALLGSLMTLAAVVLFDKAVLGRSHRRPPASPAPASPPTTKGC